jgi:tetratricopeptide (TPR) repeat protein
MKFSAVVLTLTLAAACAFGQRFKIGDINTETPEGQMIAQIGLETDEAKKVALMEQFAQKFPNDKALGWLYEQMQSIYVKLNQPDKAIEIGEKIIALDPEHAEAAHQNLKAAESKKDPELIKKWAMQTNQIASKAMASPQPKDEDEVDTWKKRVAWAAQVKTYTDYTLYALALQATDPKKKVELIEALKAQNPQSEYLPKTIPALFLAYRQSGDNDKAVALAEQVLEKDQSDEDMLLVVANNYLEKKRDPEKVHAYSAKLVQLMTSKPKPEGVSDADWQNRKNTIVGIAHYMSGKLYYTQSKFAPADKELREALPLVQNNPQLKPEVLFLLGFANFKMEKIQDAFTFYKQCAEVKSSFAGTCAKNVTAIRTQYRGVK